MRLWVRLGRMINLGRYSYNISVRSSRHCQYEIVAPVGLSDMDWVRCGLSFAIVSPRLVLWIELYELVSCWTRAGDSDMVSPIIVFLQHQANEISNHYMNELVQQFLWKTTRGEEKEAQSQAMMLMAVCIHELLLFLKLIADEILLLELFLGNLTSLFLPFGWCLSGFDARRWTTESDIIVTKWLLQFGCPRLIICIELYEMYVTMLVIPRWFFCCSDFNRVASSIIIV